jgi:rhomboid family GlyGly-CTERM serine protease
MHARFVPAIPVVALAAVALLATPSLSPLADTLSDVLRYERAAVLDGAWWRLFTAHVVHLDGVHLALNALALGCLLLLCRPVMTVLQALACLLLYAPAVGLGLLLFSPDVAWYAGLSGVLHGLLVTVACLLLRVRTPAASLLLAGVLLKLAAEQAGLWSTGDGAWLDEPVIVEAHLYGALAGLCGAWLFLATGRGCRSSPAVGSDAARPWPVTRT